jgi:Uma2 family endonuclease
LGKIISAPFEVKLWPDGPSREPDLLFVSNDNLERLGEKRFDGGPDLVVEIVSAGSVREDKVRKFDEYEQAGVSEYWIIDPRQRQETAEFFQRDESGIYQPIEVDEVGVYQSYTLPGFWLNVDWLWMDPLPNHQLKLAEIVKDNTAVPEQLRQLYAGLYDFLSQS